MTAVNICVCGSICVSWFISVWVFVHEWLLCLSDHNWKGIHLSLSHWLSAQFHLKSSFSSLCVCVEANRHNILQSRACCWKARWILHWPAVLSCFPHFFSTFRLKTKLLLSLSLSYPPSSFYSSLSFFSAATVRGRGLCQRRGWRGGKSKRRRLSGWSWVSVYVWMFHGWALGEGAPGENEDKEKRGGCLDEILCHVTMHGPWMIVGWGKW